VKLIPGRGVYLVEVRHGGVDHAGMMNIGVRPTVSAGTDLMLEVHILDFHRTIYGEPLTVTFHRRLREERRFGSTEELVRQLDRDREHARRLLTPDIGKPSSGAQTT
jgi:riboflavin kinase/FMN adenylyltransferase